MYTCAHTHTQTHTHIFLWNVGTSHRRNGFYTVETVCAIALHQTLHLNLALTRDCISTSPKNSLCMIYKCLKGGDMGQCSYKSPSLYLVIPMSYLCHYTNVYPHLSQKRTHTIQCEFCIQVSYALSWWLLAVCKIFSPQACHVELGQW